MSRYLGGVRVSGTGGATDYTLTENTTDHTYELRDGFGNLASTPIPAGADEITALTIPRNAQGQDMEQWEDAGSPGGTFTPDSAFALNYIALARGAELLEGDNYSQMIIATENGANYHNDLLFFEADGGRMILKVDNLVTALANLHPSLPDLEEGAIWTNDGTKTIAELIEMVGIVDADSASGTLGDEEEQNLIINTSSERERADGRWPTTEAWQKANFSPINSSNVIFGDSLGANASVVIPPNHWYIIPNNVRLYLYYNHGSAYTITAGALGLTLSQIAEQVQTDGTLTSVNYGSLFTYDVSSSAKAIPMGSMAWVSATEQYINLTGSQVAGVDGDFTFGTGWLRLGDGGSGGSNVIIATDLLDGESFTVGTGQFVSVTIGQDTTLYFNRSSPVTRNGPSLLTFTKNTFDADADLVEIIDEGDLSAYQINLGLTANTDGDVVFDQKDIVLQDDAEINFHGVDGTSEAHIDYDHTNTTLDLTPAPNNHLAINVTGTGKAYVGPTGVVNNEIVTKGDIVPDPRFDGSITTQTQVDSGVNVSAVTTILDAVTDHMHTIVLPTANPTTPFAVGDTISTSGSGTLYSIIQLIETHAQTEIVFEGDVTATFTVGSDLFRSSTPTEAGTVWTLPAPGASAYTQSNALNEEMIARKTLSEQVQANTTAIAAFDADLVSIAAYQPQGTYLSGAGAVTPSFSTDQVDRSGSKTGTGYANTGELRVYHDGRFEVITYLEMPSVDNAPSATYVDAFEEQFRLEDIIGFAFVSGSYDTLGFPHILNTTLETQYDNGHGQGLKAYFLQGVYQGRVEVRFQGQLTPAQNSDRSFITLHQDNAILYDNYTAYQIYPTNEFWHNVRVADPEQIFLLKEGVFLLHEISDAATEANVGKVLAITENENFVDTFNYPSGTVLSQNLSFYLSRPHNGTVTFAGVPAGLTATLVGNTVTIDYTGTVAAGGFTATYATTGIEAVDQASGGDGEVRIIQPTGVHLIEIAEYDTNAGSANEGQWYWRENQITNTAVMPSTWGDLVVENGNDASRHQIVFDGSTDQDGNISIMANASVNQGYLFISTETGSAILGVTRFSGGPTNDFRLDISEVLNSTGTPGISGEIRMSNLGFASAGNTDRVPNGNGNGHMLIWDHELEIWREATIIVDGIDDDGNDEPQSFGLNSILEDVTERDLRRTTTREWQETNLLSKLGANNAAAAYVAIQFTAGIPTDITSTVTNPVTGFIYLQYTANYLGDENNVLVDVINTSTGATITYDEFVLSTKTGTEVPQK